MMSTRCEHCIYYEYVRSGVGYCRRRNEVILFPERYRDCEFYVPRDIMAEDFLERAYAEIVRRGLEKKEGVGEKLRRSLRKVFSALTGK